MRSFLLPVTLALSAAAAEAQTLTANFDVQPEGLIGHSYTEGGLTFQNLENPIPGGPNIMFAIDRAEGTLAGQPGFTPVNTLSFGGLTMGPNAGFRRCKSFEIVWGGATASAARLELYEFGNSVGNTVTMQGLFGATVVASSTVTITGGLVLTHHTLQVAGAPFDSLRVVGNGPNDNGTFFAVVDTARVELSAGIVFCAGDDLGTACPCGNPSMPSEQSGCSNSLGLGGRLRATGTASIAADSVVLVGSQLPNSSALYFQGTSQQSGGNGVVFGDGLRCAAGTIVRLATKSNSSGISQFPAVGDPSLSVRGLVTTPGTRTYQVWYRNASSFCTPSTFNLTNGVSLIWS